MSKLVSVIVPVFNVEDYIRKSLDSILNQSFSFENIEVIMVDDASSDGSGKIIDEYSVKYDNFKAIHLDKNSGAAGRPRNIGINESNSDFIMFLDSDDYFSETAIETLYNKIISDDELDIVLGGYVNIHGSNKQIVLPFKESNDKYISDTTSYSNLMDINPAICAKIFRKSFLIENNIEFPESIPGQDLVFFLDAFFNARNVLLLNKFIVYYRVLRFDDFNKSISLNITSKYIMGLIDAYSLTLDVCVNNKVSENLVKLLLLSHLQFFTNQILKDEVSSNDLVLIFNSPSFQKFRNHVFFSSAKEFKLIFTNLVNGVFDNRNLIEYIKSNVEKEMYYRYDNIKNVFYHCKNENKKLLVSLRVMKADNIYLKNKNKELHLEIRNMNSSKFFKVKRLFD